MNTPTPIYVDCEQRSVEWFMERCGKVTASRVCDVVAKLKRKDGEAAQRLHYKWELVSEILTERCEDHYVSKYMEWGVETEELARAAYEVSSDLDVRPIGFVIHPTMPRFGASPDALVGDAGILEIKCLKTENHLQAIISGEVPEEHLPQIVAQLAVTGREWCDFESYDPRLPRHLQMFQCRVLRDDPLVKERTGLTVAAVELEVQQFLSEIDVILEQLNPEKGQP